VKLIGIIFALYKGHIWFLRLWHQISTLGCIKVWVWLRADRNWSSLKVYFVI